MLWSTVSVHKWIQNSLAVTTMLYTSFGNLYYQILSVHGHIDEYEFSYVYGMYMYIYSPIINFPNSILYSGPWGDCEAVLMTGSGFCNGEGIVWLYEVVTCTVSTGNSCWVIIICHIGDRDEDSVPDVMIYPHHIWGVRRAPVWILRMFYSKVCAVVSLKKKQEASCTVCYPEMNPLIERVHG